MSSSSTTPYLERLKEGLRQVRPSQMDDLWTVPPPPPASASNNDQNNNGGGARRRRDHHDRRPWGMDDNNSNNMGHLYAENLDWWCSRPEILQLLRNDSQRLERLVHVMVTSATWITSLQQDTTTSIISRNSNCNIATTSKHCVYVSHCVGCNFPFDASSSSSSSHNHNGKYSNNCDIHGTAASPVVLLPSVVAARREKLLAAAAAAPDDDIELHLHLLIITMSVICSLIRHCNKHNDDHDDDDDDHDDDEDATDRLILLLSVDTPSSINMSLLEEYYKAASTNHTTTTTADADADQQHQQVSRGQQLQLLPLWIEQQVREGKAQAVIPLVAILQQISSSSGMLFNKKAAVGAAGLLSLITCHRPAVIFNTLQQQQHLDVFISSLYTYLDQVCLPLLRAVVINHHNDDNGDNRTTTTSTSSSSCCLVQERFGLVAFFNILPTLYHLASWEAARCHVNFDKIVVALVSCMVHICHSATTTTTNNNNFNHNHNTDSSSRSDNNKTYNNDKTNINNNDGPADLENLVELIGAKFTILESLLLLQPVQQQQPLQQQQQQRPEQSPFQALSTSSLVHDDDDDDNDNWRMTLLRQRPMSTAVAAGLEVLSLWTRHGVDLQMIMMIMHDDDENNHNDNGNTPRVKMPRSRHCDATTTTTTTLEEEDDDADNSSNKDGTTTMMSISACLTKYLPRIVILTQRVAPHLGYMETMARSLAALGVVKKPPPHHHLQHHVDNSSNTSSMASSALFLEESFSLARDRCGLPTCRRRERRAEVVQQQQQQGGGGGDTNGDIFTCRSTSSSSTKSLKICHGGCKGLERYCCRDHQKEHWPIHKLYCKNNVSNS